MNPLVMAAGATDCSEQLRIVDGSTPEVVTWARALVSRQWRHGAPLAMVVGGAWQRLTGGPHFIKMGFVGGELLRSPFLLLGFPKTAVLEHPRAPRALLLLIGGSTDNAVF